MELEGKVWKDGKFWVVEIPCLNVSTQGKTKKEALSMIEDALFELMKSYFGERGKGFKISINSYEYGDFGLTSNDTKLLLSFLLIRQREENGLSIRDVAAQLDSKNPNSYAQYEKGKINFSIDQYEKLIRAINPQRPPVWRVI